MAGVTGKCGEAKERRAYIGLRSDLTCLQGCDLTELLIRSYPIMEGIVESHGLWPARLLFLFMAKFVSRG